MSHSVATCDGTDLATASITFFDAPSSKAAWLNLSSSGRRSCGATSSDTLIASTTGLSRSVTGSPNVIVTSCPNLGNHFGLSLGSGIILSKPVIQIGTTSGILSASISILAIPHLNRLSLVLVLTLTYPSGNKCTQFPSPSFCIESSIAF